MLIKCHLNKITEGTFMKNQTALDVQDVANILNIAKNTVYELIKRGEINSYKVGRKVRFTMKDVEDYISGSKKIRIPEQCEICHADHGSAAGQNEKGFVICGQDLVLDALVESMQKEQLQQPVLRSYLSSYDGLVELYRGNAAVTAAHLWDSSTNTYNIPFVRALLPGVPAVIVHLTVRTQGFFVAKGNPRRIKGWKDLGRRDIRIVNREKGAGSRVLLDEHLRLLGIKASSVNGYYTETAAHVGLASTVGRGDADIAVGSEFVARQVESVDFIPLQKESFELVIKKEDFETERVRQMMRILKSSQFRQEFEGIAGYDAANMGTIVAEI